MQVNGHAHTVPQGCTGWVVAIGLAVSRLLAKIVYAFLAAVRANIHGKLQGKKPLCAAVAFRTNCSLPGPTSPAASRLPARVWSRRFTTGLR